MTTTIAEPGAIRETMEDSWRVRLEETQARYKQATERRSQLPQEQPHGGSSGLNGRFALARQQESEALAEYTRVLRLFTDLTVKGKIPEESHRFERRMDAIGRVMISIVDDDESVSTATKALLSSAGYEV